ncbi:hypothetical protein B0H19DRAFT_1376834 [Mycena capillaripes]|nr:hypothetical protein B0H19DRAFT_1376834 [Mycena capillaripes]
MRTPSLVARPYNARGSLASRVPPAESLFLPEDQGTHVSITILKVRIRSSPFSPPAPSSSPLCPLDSSASCGSVALLSSFSLLPRHIRDAAVHWALTMEREPLRLHAPLKPSLTGSAPMVGGTGLL